MQKNDNFYNNFDDIFDAVKSLPKKEAPDSFKSELLQRIENMPKEDNKLLQKSYFFEKFSKKRYIIGVPAACIIALFAFVYSGSMHKGFQGGGSSSYSYGDYSYGEAAPAAEAPAAAPIPSNAVSSAEIAFESGVVADFAMAEEAVAPEGIDGSDMRQSATANQSANSSESSQKISKIIKTSHYSIDIIDFDKFISELQHITEVSGGYVERFTSHIYDSFSDSNGRRHLKSGGLTLRIPQDTYANAKTKIESLGTVTGTSESIDDVTSNYVDMSARLDVKRAEEQRLLELFAKAEKIEDLISLETRLTYVRSDIESMLAQLSNWDNSVFFSTIDISVTEVIDYSKIQPIDPTLSEKIVLGFNRSVASFTYTIERLVISIAENSLAIIIFTLALIIVYVIIKKYINKRSF